MKRPKKAELDRLICRVVALRPEMPSTGLTLAAFEALALTDVPPNDVAPMVRLLGNRRIIYIRKNRGDIRIYGERPAEIAGVFEGPKAVDRLLSAAIPHVRRVAGALGTLDGSKASRRSVDANAARDALDVSAVRLIDLVRDHEARGVSLAEIRDIAWSVFAPDIMSFLSGFEPALRRDAICGLTPKTARPTRIRNGLGPREKVVALIKKAGPLGVLKRDLYQGIRPKLAADELAAMLDELVRTAMIEPRVARVHGRRFATRYVTAETAGIK